MSEPGNFLRDTRAASAAEFALVLPIFLIFMVGIIDVGLYAWSINRAEKATQIGTRWAVATELVPSALRDYSYAVSGGVPQGTPVPQASFPDITCEGTTTVSCTGNTLFTAANQAAFAAIVSRMSQIDRRIANENVRVIYSWSGLGYAGDPNGPDVAPIVTIELSDLEFSPITGLIFGATVDLPTLTYSLTNEDGMGDFSN
jgi:hypothetical protein